jgi:ribosomal RNA-processing protein 9
MSSFFTLPAFQRKRKREDRSGAPATKKRGVDADGDVRNKGGRKNREREESISGSDLDEDAESVAPPMSDEESGSESDEGETAADRRLKLAERYLDNVRDEVDDYGFDAAEIDRDLIAERLKEDVVCRKAFCDFDPELTIFLRTNSKDEYIVKLLLT